MLWIKLEIDFTEELPLLSINIDYRTENPASRRPFNESRGRRGQRRGDSVEARLYYND